MKTIFIMPVLLAFLVLPLTAQKNKDALYLKNGSIIYGRLIEINDNKYRIQTSDGSQFIFSSDEVDRFMKEIPDLTGMRTNGFGFTLEAGLLIGSQETQFSAPFSFNILGSHTFGTMNSIGFGSGVEFLGTAFMPVFFEYRRLFNERKVAPFVFFRGGTLLHAGGDEEEDPYYYPNYTKDYKGGTSLAIGSGISWAKEDYETYLSFAYRYARTSYKQENYDHVTYTYKTNFNRLEMKFGFKF